MAAVKETYEALRGWLTGQHDAGAVDLIAQSEKKPEYAALIKDELARPEVAADPEVTRLAEALRAAIAAIPPAEEARYAVDIRKGIEAARNISLKNIEGILADSIKAGEDLTMEGIKAPPGKP